MLKYRGFTLLRSIKVNRSGFTLVELLVTISILSILMTIAMISYGNVQKNARDAKRKSDLSTIQAALEQYHADLGFYPFCINTRLKCGQLNKIQLPLTSSTDNPNPPSNEKTYLSPIPLDPINKYTGAGNPYYIYSYVAQPDECDNLSTKCNNYCIYNAMENPSNAIFATMCPSISVMFNYSVANP